MQVASSRPLPSMRRTCAYSAHARRHSGSLFRRLAEAQPAARGQAAHAQVHALTLPILLEDQLALLLALILACAAWAG